MSSLDRRAVLAASTLGVTSLALPLATAAASPVDPPAPTVPTVQADALVQAANPTTNYPSSGLLLKNHNTVHRICYVRFDLTSLAWASAAAPELTLTTSANNDNTPPNYPPTTFAVEVYGLREGTSGYAWVESTLTWNSRPAGGSLVSGRYVPSSDATLLGEIAVGAVAAPDSCTLASEDLRTFIRGLSDPSVTFILIRKDVLNTNLAFHDRESAAANEAPSLAPTLTLG